MTRRTALVVNCSAPHYNLGAHKCADWLREQGHAVTLAEGDPGLWGVPADVVYLSVVFSWHAPVAAEIARRLRGHADVEVGGPGMSTPSLLRWWQTETGLPATTVVRGLDARFDKQRGRYDWTFAARGCTVGCSFCIVPQIEGRTFSFDPGFIPAPNLGDNNLSGLPVEWQEAIIARYGEFGMALRDANSGFEPRSFDEETYRRWKPLMRHAQAWRFAFDELEGERGRAEAEGVERMAAILAGESSRRKMVYCLVGNEPFAACYERAQRILALGCEPWCQVMMPLNLVEDPFGRDPCAMRLRMRYDWRDYQQARDFCRFYNRRVWRYAPLWEYRPRKGEPPPFAWLAPPTVSVATRSHPPLLEEGDRPPC